MSRFSAAVIAISLLCVSTPCAAEVYDFRDAGVPVAKHIRKPGGERFFPKSGVKESADSNAFAAMEYRAYFDQLPSGAGTYDVKPPCERAAVKRTKVLVRDDYVRFFDIVFYDYRSGEQARRADAWPYPSAPFLEGDAYNPHRKRKDLQQDVARMFGISCLPTRVHFVLDNGEQYEEHREGSAAWELPAQ